MSSRSVRSQRYRSHSHSRYSEKERSIRIAVLSSAVAQACALEEEETAVLFLVLFDVEPCRIPAVLVLGARKEYSKQK